VVRYKFLKYFAKDSFSNCLTPKRLTELNSQIEIYAKDRLLNYLAYKERSVYQAKFFLQNLPLKNTISKKIISQMLELDFINDERFADLLAKSLVNSNISKIMARRKLYLTGLKEQIAEKALEKHYADSSFVIEKAVEKAFSKYKHLPLARLKQRSLAWLMRRGFSFVNIADLLSKKIQDL